MQVSHNILGVTAPATLLAPEHITVPQTFNPKLQLAQLKSAMDKAGDAMNASFDEYVMKEIARMDGEIAVYDFMLEKFKGQKGQGELLKELRAERADDLKYQRELKAKNPALHIWIAFGEDADYKAVSDAFNEAAEAYEVFKAQTHTKGATA